MPVNVDHRVPRLVCVTAALAIVTLTVRCTHRVSRFYPEIMNKKMIVSLPMKANQKDKLSITYFGCGNMLFEMGGESIMTDPFFSNQGVMKMIGKIRTKPDLYALWKGRLEQQAGRSTVRAVLVSHSHYDHMMDLPTLLHDHYFPKLEAVYGNENVPSILANFSKEGPRFEELTEDRAFNPNVPRDSTWQWIAISPHMRFLPIQTDHAPHTKRKLFMNKKLKPEYFKDNLVWPGDKTKPMKWTTGTSYAFLIDFIGADTLRVFVQTSASHYPNGLPPKALMDKRKVDLAIMCYASAPNVGNYPKGWVDWMEPKKLMLVHWEDFFREAKSDDDVKLVRATKPRKVRQRIDALGKKADFFIMPKPGTRVDVGF